MQKWISASIIASFLVPLKNDRWFLIRISRVRIAEVWEDDDAHWGFLLFFCHISWTNLYNALEGGPEQVQANSILVVGQTAPLPSGAPFEEVLNPFALLLRTSTCLEDCSHHSVTEKASSSQDSELPTREYNILGMKGDGKHYEGQIAWLSSHQYAFLPGRPTIS